MKAPTRTIGNIDLYRTDCMDVMRQCPDKYFDIAIVDPPYGHETFDNGRFGSIFNKYKVKRTGGSWASKYKDNINGWDVAPPPEYFNELFRISQYQFIFGGNYFLLPPSRNFFIWEKGISDTFTMAMVEFAWTNVPGNAKIYSCCPQGTSRDKRFHPTQKTVKLYHFILKHYTKPNMKIIDTHFGSGSLEVACIKAQCGYQVTACEIDDFYFEKAVERLEIVNQQYERTLLKQEAC
ncbi:methyltransferase [Planctomycetales bacterium]|nr:methyltransferase [Planctomycetales bacterium]